MPTIRMLAILIGPLLGAAPKPEEMQANSFKKNPEAAGKYALEGKNPYIAATAFAGYVEARTDPNDKATLALVRSYAMRRDMTKAALVLVHKWDTPALNTLVSRLAPSRMATDRRLASAVLAAAAVREHLKTRRAAAPPRGGVAGGGNDAGEDDPKKAKKKKARGKRGKKGAAGGALAGDALPGLIADKDSVVSALAILAAAYMRDEGSADAVAKLTKPDEMKAGPALLYRARTGAKITDDEVAAVWKKVQRSRGRIPKPDGDLFENYLLVPGACSACEAFGEIKGEAVHAPLRSALAYKDIRVQVAAVRAIGRIQDDELVKSLLKGLPTCSWPVLVESCLVLGEVPIKEAIPVLIKRLGREKGRFRLDIEYALSCIAGADRGDSAKGWASWWRREEKDFAVDPEASRRYREQHWLFDQGVQPNGYFYGLFIYSDRFCFVVDTSASMKNQRIESLRSEMTTTIKDMARHVQYNIVDFGGDIVTMHEDGLTHDRAKGLERVKTMPLTGGTRSFDAMERAALLYEVDTLMFLSDGAPVRGQFDGWDNIRSALFLQTRFYPLAVFSIDFNAGKGNLENMKGMADEHYGQSESIEVDKPEPKARKKKKDDEDQ